MSNGVLPTDPPEDDVFKCATCIGTLHEPVLLECLHSVCSSCTSNATATVTCPVCQITTDTSARKTNKLVSSLEHRSLILKNTFSCSHCMDEAKEDATAVAWCYVCQQPLCTELQKYHKILLPAHNVTPLNESTLLSELYRPPVRYCTKHGEELKLVCFACQDCRCYKCAHELCYTSSHDVLPVDDPNVVKRIDDMVADVTRLRLDLSSTAAPLLSYSKLPETVANARSESLNTLQNAKRAAIGSINRAYAKAESSLLECWDTLLSKSLCLRESVERLQARLDWVQKYCQLALSSNDVAGVFPQLEAIISALSTLLVEVRRVKKPTDPLTMVSLNVALPCDLDLITGDWLGLTKIVSDDFTSSVSDLPTGSSTNYYAKKVSTLMELEQLHQDRKEEQKRYQCVLQSLEQLQTEMKVKNQQLISAQNNVTLLLKQQQVHQSDIQRERQELQRLIEQWCTPSMPLQFYNAPKGTFRMPCNFWNVAVTPQGRLLVAAMADGLKEYDATNFHTISTWMPDNDNVSAVDVLSDERTVVGLYNTHTVVLLRREVDSKDQWLVVRQVAKLQDPPRSLSVWGDRLLLVLEDRYSESELYWSSGPGLSLLSLDDGKELHRQELEYNSVTVALTDRCFIVASNDEVAETRSFGGLENSKTGYVMDCFSYAGVRLWRHWVRGGLKVTGICTDSVGRVLYALRSCGTVVAHSMDVGRELCRVIKASTKQKERVYSLALDRASRQQLALLRIDDGKASVVDVYSVV